MEPPRCMCASHLLGMQPGGRLCAKAPPDAPAADFWRGWWLGAKLLKISYHPQGGVREP